MLIVDQVSVSLTNTTILERVEFQAQPGEITAVIGPNGSGKSTTMKMATGYLKADSGTSTICGVDMEVNPKEAKKLIGYLPEGAPAYGEMTTIGFLNFIADIRGFYGKKRAIQIDKAVERARIKHVLHQQIDTLSKGYKRRVGLSQAIMHEPKILILDEPTDGLDPNQKHHVRELITEISKTTAIIVSTHILEEVDAVCSSVLLINKGNVVLNGSSSELRSKVESNNSIMIKIDPKSTEDLKRLLLTIPSISKIDVLNETESNVNINIYPKENQVILTEVAKIIADHKFPVKDIYQNHIALDEAFRKLTV